MIYYANIEGEAIVQIGTMNLNDYSKEIELNSIDEYVNYGFINNEFVEIDEEKQKELYPFLFASKEISIQKAKMETMMLESMKESFLSKMTDVQALSIPLCFDGWETGVAYAVGDRVQYDGKLWKCRQAHTSQDGWQPSINTASLWETINETNQGTIDDPIPYDQTMTVYSGKYYLENGTKYKCIRDSGQPLYATCESLVGNYFVVA